MASKREAARNSLFGKPGGDGTLDTDQVATDDR
jgi:hypothetical protein